MSYPSVIIYMESAMVTHRDRPTSPSVRVAQGITEPLHLVGVKANVVLDHHAAGQLISGPQQEPCSSLVGRPRGALQAAMRLEIEVEGKRVAHGGVDDGTCTSARADSGQT